MWNLLISDSYMELNIYLCKQWLVATNEPKWTCLPIYSCCSLLKHRTSVKRFVSLQFLNLRQSVGLLGWGISQSQGGFLHTEQHKRRQTSMPWVGFEPTIPVFELAKTVYALDRTGTLIGSAQKIFAHYGRVELLSYERNFGEIIVKLKLPWNSLRIAL
jgi:hypothetical protein